MAGVPNSYADPFWSDLATKAEQKLGLPGGLLVSILTKGERSNNDQVSEADARTPFQIIPATQKAAIKKYGMDPYLSPENAAEVAGNLLKDSLARNKGNAALAVAEYHGGTNRDNWGPRTKAYVKRVTGLSPDAALSGGAAPATAPQAGSTFDRVSKQMGFEPIPESTIAAVHAAYKAGQMTPEEAKAFEGDIAAGRIMLPRGAATEGPAMAAGIEVLPAEVLAAYNDGRMSNAEKMQLEADVAAGGVTLPPGAKLGKTERDGIIDNLKEAVTGDKRRTAETEALPDWTSMPELNDASGAGLKTGLGTMLSNPEESVQIIQSNFPGVKARKDERGNIFLRSSMDGQEYAIKPGFRPSDIPRAGAGIAAFTPAGGMRTIFGSAVASGGTQAAIEASQAAAGGNFDGGEVAVATALGGVVPTVVRGVQAAAQPARQLVNRVRGIDTPAPPGPGPTPVPPAMEVLPAEELANTARTAALGGMGSKNATTVLAEQAMPDAKTVEAAKRLGIFEHLQPDHVTTNQVYRELAQGVKSFPGSTTRAAEVSGLEAVAKRADDLIEQIGGTTDMSLLDKTIKGRMQATQQELVDKAEDLYAQVRAAIPAQTRVEVSNTLGFLKQHAEDVGGANRLLPTEKKLLASLAGDDGALTYAFLDQTRKQIGQAMRKASGPFADSESGMLKKLYSTLSADQGAAAAAAGADDLYKAAQSAVAVRKSLEDDLAALFGKELDKSMIGGLQSSLKALPSGDSAKLIALLKSVPEDMRQYAVASGLSSAFRVSAKNGNLSFPNYANWYESLSQNKQAKAALMSNLPLEARKQLSDLYRVAKGISAASRERITTGRISAMEKQLAGGDTLMGNLYDVAKRSTAGLAAEAVTTPLGMPGSGMAAGIASALTKGKPQAIKAADALISSPEFAALVRSVGTAGEEHATRRLAMSKAFRDFVRAIGQERAMSQPEKWILRNLNAINSETTAPQTNRTLH